MSCPRRNGVPLARWSRAELARHAQETGLVGAISGRTIWRWLSKDAIRPWQHRSWLFPRDPQFAQEAAPVLDLYQRRWKGQPLHDDERRSRRKAPFTGSTSSPAIGGWRRNWGA